VVLTRFCPYMRWPGRLFKPDPQMPYPEDVLPLRALLPPKARQSCTPAWGAAAPGKDEKAADVLVAESKALAAIFNAEQPAGRTTLPLHCGNGSVEQDRRSAFQGMRQWDGLSPLPCE